jgi:stage V sporulation protein D (sporulation-specific penicillin-binding protein)
MDDPQYIVLVALDTPSRSTGLYISGGVMAAPTVGSVLADILPYLGVQEKASAEKPVILEDLTGLSRQEVNAYLKKQGITGKILGEETAVTGQLPLPGAAIPPGSELLIYFGEVPDTEMVAVPDFSGMNRQQAAEAAGKVGLYLIPEGNDELLPSVQVTAQSHPKGTMVPMGTTITVTFTDISVQD